MKPLSKVLETSRVVVCCGAGGVGKTTTSAALALAAARLGKRVLVLTIDPARRLAQAMGIPEHAATPTALSAEQLRAAGVTGEGTLDAWMLNPRVVFDGLVRKLAPSPEQAERILKLRLYQAMAELVAGMQEYTAAEALYDFSVSGKYDLIVLDTPPSRNALEFLEAPGKLSRFLDEKVISLFLPSEQKGFSFFKKATELIGTVFVRVFGESFFKELQEFLSAFSGMFSAMRSHSEKVRALLKSKDANFILVTSPEQAALEEARYFRSRLVEMGLPFGGFVLNRSWARLDGLTDPATSRPEGKDAALLSAWTKLEQMAEQERKLADRDNALLTSLVNELGVTEGFALAGPNLGEAIADVPGLARLAEALVPVGS